MSSDYVTHIKAGSGMCPLAWPAMDAAPSLHNHGDVIALLGFTGACIASDDHYHKLLALCHAHVHTCTCMCMCMMLVIYNSKHEMRFMCLCYLMTITLS